MVTFLFKKPPTSIMELGANGNITTTDTDYIPRIQEGHIRNNFYNGITNTDDGDITTLINNTPNSKYIPEFAKRLNF